MVEREENLKVNVGKNHIMITEKPKTKCCDITMRMLSNT